MNNLTKILGPPGTGKTTRLVEIVKQMIAEGVDPRRIAYVSFTRKAADVAAMKACEALQVNRARLEWFRTVHSLCFRMLSLNPKHLIRRKDLEELGDRIGIDFTFRNVEEESAATSGEGDKILFLENLSRITGRSLREVWNERSFAWGSSGHVPYEALVEFAAAYARHKVNNGLIDFTDAIERFVKLGRSPAVDHLIVDEAQDLSDAQWKVIRIIAATVKTTWIAGDDDQAIHAWAGADSETFQQIQGHNDDVVLDQSYRMPRAIHQLATGISSKISRRLAKDFKPRDADGSVELEAELDQVDLSSGTWFMLARHGYQLKEYETICRDRGWLYERQGQASNQTDAARAVIAWEQLRAGKTVPVVEIKLALAGAGLNDPKLKITREELSMQAGDLTLPTGALDLIWHEALVKIPEEEREYLLTARRNGERLTREPRIKISTIHGAKGGEADGVVLRTEVSEATYQEMERDADNEHRVFYVGASRARERLIVTRADGLTRYDL